MTDRSAQIPGAITVAQAKRMYHKTLSLWVMDYLESRSLLQRQRGVRINRPIAVEHTSAKSYD
ncbi:MAG: hypothetical protein ACYTGQ_09720 [Planctomycetota bacterium]|jgi:hypothetical protein